MEKSGVIMSGVELKGGLINYVRNPAGGVRPSDERARRNSCNTMMIVGKVEILGIKTRAPICYSIIHPCQIQIFQR